MDRDERARAGGGAGAGRRIARCSGGGPARAGRALQGSPRQSRIVVPGGRDREETRRPRPCPGLRGDGRRRQDRRGRGAEERRRPHGDAARRHGRAAGDRADGAALRLEAPCGAGDRDRDRGDARLRPRYPHGRLGGHGAAAGRAARAVVGHTGDDPPACRGNRRGRQGDARRRALHPLSQARLRARLPRCGAISGGADRLFQGLCAGERRFGRCAGEGGRRTRGLSAHHQGPGRHRLEHRHAPANAGEPRAEPDSRSR